MALAKVLIPFTVKLVPVTLLVIVGVAPLIIKEPTIRVLARRSRVVPLLIVSKLNSLPSVPVLVSARVPPLMVVEPP